MVPIPREGSASSVLAEGGAGTGAGSEEAPMEVDETAEVRGHPELAPTYVTRLLPTFTHVFQSSMIQSIRLVN